MDSDAALFKRRRKRRRPARASDAQGNRGSDRDTIQAEETAKEQDDGKQRTNGKSGKMAESRELAGEVCGSVVRPLWFSAMYQRCYPLYISIHTKPIISTPSFSLACPVLQFFPPRYRRLPVALSLPGKLTSAMGTLEINSEITEPREYREKDRDVSRQYR